MENSKKIAKKLEILKKKKNIMASFQAEICSNAEKERK